MYPPQDPYLALSLAHELQQARLEDAELRRIARRSRSITAHREPRGTRAWRLLWRRR